MHAHSKSIDTFRANFNASVLGRLNGSIKINMQEAHDGIKAALDDFISAAQNHPTAEHLVSKFQSAMTRAIPGVRTTLEQNYHLCCKDLGYSSEQGEALRVDIGTFEEEHPLAVFHAMRNKGHVDKVDLTLHGSRSRLVAAVHAAGAIGKLDTFEQSLVQLDRNLAEIAEPLEEIDQKRGYSVSVLEVRQIEETRSRAYELAFNRSGALAAASELRRYLGKMVKGQGQVTAI